MTVYLLNIAFIALWAYVFLAPKKKLTIAAPEKYFSVIAAMQWVLISGLRHISVGADTEAYKIYSFDVVKNYSWKRLWNNFVDGIFLGEEIKDPGYNLLQKVFQIFCKDYQVWLIFIALVFTVPMAVWIYKKSKNPFMSFLIYSCLFYSFFAITGHRQTIAMGVVVFIGDFLIKKRKFLPFLLMTLIMATVHKSCLVFIPFYFLCNKKVTILYIFSMIATMIIVFIFKEPVILFLGETSGYDYGIYEGAGAYTFTILLIMVVMVALWRRKYILEQGDDVRSCFNAMFLAMVFVPLTFAHPATMRVVQYFSVYIMLLVPEIITSLKEKDKALANVVLVFVLLFFFIRNNPQYMFFWE